MDEQAQQPESFTHSEASAQDSEQDARVAGPAGVARVLSGHEEAIDLRPRPRALALDAVPAQVERGAHRGGLQVHRLSCQP